MEDSFDEKIEKITHVYGVRPLIEALKAGLIPDKVFMKSGLRGEQVPELIGLLRQCDVHYNNVPEEKLNRLTRQNHQGVFAFISPVEFYDLETVVQQSLDAEKTPLILILDQITDVRNFGAIVRTAECTGVNAIVIPSQGAAPISADALKTSAGALFRLPICKVQNLVDATLILKSLGLQIVASSEKTENLVYNVDFTTPTALIMGNEEKGISNQLLRLCNAKAKLPLAGKIGSLNVSVACGAVLYEVLRQRNTL